MAVIKVKRGDFEEEKDFIASIDDDVKKVIAHTLSRCRTLKNKKDPWLTQYQILGEFLYTRKQDFLNEETPGEFLTDHLFDSTGPKAVKTAAASLTSMLWPQEVERVRLNPPEGLTDTKEHKEYYEKITEILTDIMDNPEGGLTTSIIEMMQDDLVFGTAGLEPFPDDDTIVGYRPWGVQQMSIDEGRKGEVDTICLELDWDYQRQVMEYGIENVAPKVRKAFNDGNVDETSKIMILIEPRIHKRGDPKSGNRSMDWSSVHIDSTNKHLIKESGFEEMPVKVSRFWKLIRETYGRSPGMDALPDVQEVNTIWESVTIAIEKNLDPPLGVIDDGSLGGGELDSSAGGITVFNVSGRAAEKNPVFPLFTVGEIKQTVQLIETLDGSITEHFFLDRLLDFNNQTQMTLGEANLRNKLRNSTLGSVFFRLIKEIFTPLIKRTFNIAFDKNKLGVVENSPEHQQMLDEGRPNILLIPEEIAKRMVAGEDVYQIRFFTPAMRIMQSEEAEGILRTWEFAGQLAGMGVPSALDNLDEDESVRRMADIQGAPSEIKRARKGGDESVEAIRERRAQQAAAQAKLEQGMAAATMAQQVGNSGLVPTNESEGTAA